MNAKSSTHLLLKTIFLAISVSSMDAVVGQSQVYMMSPFDRWPLNPHYYSNVARNNPVWSGDAIPRNNAELTCPQCPVVECQPPQVTTHQLPSDEQLITSCSSGEATYTAANSGNITIKFSPSAMRCNFHIVAVAHATDVVTFFCYDKTSFSSFTVTGSDPAEIGHGLMNKVYISAKNYLIVSVGARFPNHSIKCRWDTLEKTKVAKVV